jgi:hypothetical protein
MDTRIIRKLLLEAKSLVDDFLKEQKGEWVKGEVEINYHTSLDWLPKNKKITLKEVSDRGYSLNEQLIRVLEKYDAKGTIEIIRKHLGHGVYSIRLVYIEKYTLYEYFDGTICLGIKAQVKPK